MRTALKSAATARYQLASILTTNRQRSAVLGAVAALVSSWGLAAIDPATFGRFIDATGTDSCSINNGAAILTSPDDPWTAADVGKAIDVAGAGVAGGVLSTWILGYTNAGQVTLADSASTTVAASKNSAGGLAIWGDAVGLETYSEEDALIDATGRKRQHPGARGQVCVLDFGAVGDGVTDDLAAFRKAVATGRPVYVPGGRTYKLSATLDIRDGSTLFGDGESSQLLVSADNCNVVSAVGRTAVQVRDLFLNYAGTVAASDSVGWAVRLNGCARSLVVGCRTAGYLGGVVFENCTDSLMERNVCTAAPGSSATTADFMLAAVGGSCLRNSIKNCRAIAASTKGILLRAYTAGDKVDDNRVTDNLVINKSYYGIHLYRQTGTIERCIIAHNTVRGITGSYQVNYPPLRRPGGSGIFVQGGEWALVEANTVTATNSGTDWEDHAPGAIGFSDVSCAVCKGNTINDVSWYGLFVNGANGLGNGKGSVILADNIVSNTGKSLVKITEAGSLAIRGGSLRFATAGIGIHIANTVQKAGYTISGVEISDMSSNAIQVNYATDVRISGCRLSKYGNGGLLLDNATRVLVDGNEIDGSATGGGLAAVQVNANCALPIWLNNNLAFNGGAGSYGLIDNLGARYSGNNFEGFITRYSGIGGPERQLAASATPSVAGMDGCIVYPNGATTITNLTGGVGGQRITLRATGAIQVNHGSGITLQGAGNFVMAANNTLSLVFSPGLAGWIEEGRKT